MEKVKYLLLFVVISVGLGLLSACSAGSGVQSPGFGDTPTPNLTLTAIFAGVGSTELAEDFSTAVAQTMTAEFVGTETNTPTPESLLVTPGGSSRQSPTPGGPTGENGTVDDAVELVKPGELAEVDFSKRVEVENQQQRPGPSLQAFFFSKPPTIDGDLNDFESPQYAIAYPVYGSEYYTGLKDASGVFSVGWDFTNLYIGVIVDDSKFVQDALGPQLYLGDSVEVLLDLDVFGDYEDTAVSEDDIQLGLSPGNLLDKGTAENYLWAPRILEGVIADVKIVGKLTSEGYILEASIPWVSLGTAVSENQHLGFLLSIFDDDDANEKYNYSAVSFAPERILHDPTQWYDLWLVKP